MQVIELRETGFGNDGDFQIAVVDADGIQKEVRLDVVDSMPVLGDYLIVHAGFAIQKLDPKAGEETLQLFEEMVGKLAEQDSKNQ